LLGERNPQSAAEEFAPSPQGENVLDASMMAELIVTKKEIGPQLKKSAGTSRARPKCPGAGGQRLPLAGRHSAEHLILWFRGSGPLMAAGFAASVRTPTEGKSGADTATWTRVIQGHSHDRRHEKRQQSGLAGPDMACRASVICTDRTPIQGMFYVRWAVHPKAQSGMEGNNLLRIQRPRQVGIWQVVTAMKAEIHICI
jgi:hypothetical protein